MVGACSETQPPEPLEAQPAVAVESPTGEGSMAPYLLEVTDGVLLSWLEPRASGGHRFRVARLEGGEWSTPVTIAEGEDFFANWADVPKIAAAGDGTLWAHWLAKLGDDTYAYGIFLARSEDGGSSWRPMGLLHPDDDSGTEHGFVAYAESGDALRAVWLDGREMAEGGSMTVRSALLADGVGAATVVDSRACECCPTELTAISGGSVAFFRDRSDTEVRNIAVAVERRGVWSEPAPVHDDGWTIPGCPVNGPAATATPEGVAVAWFTAPEGDARIRFAFSADDGSSFSTPLALEDARPLGRVDLERGFDGEVWLSWIEQRDESATVMLSRLASDGERARLTVAATGASRASGIPRLSRYGDDLLMAWVATAGDGPSGIHLARVEIR